MRHLISAVLGIFAIGGAAAAEVKGASAAHFHLEQVVSTDIAPAELWARLIRPAAWWPSSHTYSGRAANLQVELRPGGLWQEVWATGATVHGEVLYFEEGKTLRLSAPFGPLQGMGVNVVWTLTLNPGEGGRGTRVTSVIIANGSDASGLDSLAPAVDGVFQGALLSLVETGR